jgi:steroid 5-alpha reductase family enzyme
MVALWAVAVRARNAAWVDVGWTFLVGALGVADAVLGDGAVGRRVLLGVLVGGWSVRLLVHLLGERILGQEEEGRYRRMRELLGPRADLWFLPFFLAQAVLAVLLSGVFALVASDGGPFPAIRDGIAGALWAVALGGEALADRQLARFRARPENRGKVCREGLWAWSRHPNYFFEWLVWCAYAVLALGAEGGAFGLLAPALMLVLVTRVTGIPPTEARMRSTRGAEYLRYRATTSAFVPWPPRKEEPW